ncbi:MAG: hypothetical protein HC877_22570 [Thioploca sp.]|nr:hypothetical protein [Thioploca sp.]
MFSFPTGELNLHLLKKLLIFGFIGLLNGCEPPPVHNRAVCVTLDQTHLLIPSRYFLPMFPPTLVPSQGLDQDAGELLEIPLNDLGYDIKTGQGYDRDLTFLITPISIHNFPPGLPATVAKAWGGYGLYQDRVIEFDDKAQLYRVYSTKYRVLWQFFKSLPDNSTNYSEQWVARCMTSIEKPADLLDATCKTLFLYKDIHIQMTFAGKKIKLIEELKRKVQDLFKSLEVTDCQSKFTTTSTTP